MLTLASDATFQDLNYHWTLPIPVCILFPVPRKSTKDTNQSETTFVMGHNSLRVKNYMLSS